MQLGAALMLLGHLFTPPKERLPVREWTPVYLFDRVGAGLGALWAISQHRAARFEEVRRDYAPEHERRAEDERRRRDGRDEDETRGRDGRADDERRGRDGRADDEGDDPDRPR